MLKMGSYCVYLLMCFVIPAVSFQFTQSPNKPLVVYYKNKTNVELRWDWTHPAGKILGPIKIKRYQKTVNIETPLATYTSSGTTTTDDTKYRFTVVNTPNGYASFVIKDITNQGGINVMAENQVYVYKIVVDEQTDFKEYYDEVELNTYKTPSITTYPRNQTASGGTVTFECAADGKPTPTITWEKIGSSTSFSQGKTLTLTDFNANKIGVYRCTVKSRGIPVNATGIGYVQFPTCGSGCTKDEFGIEFKDLTYNNENPSYNEYRNLKNQIEMECLIVYANAGKTIHKCEVQNFRKGSVVAVVELGWPNNTVGPKQPLLQAISDGDFAGYKVNTYFVSPTSPPTTCTVSQSTSATTTSTPKISPESDTTCSSVIAVCTTIIVILALSNAVLCFFLWKKNSELKDVCNKTRAQVAPNEHPLSATNVGHFIADRAREVPTAPIYHEISNASNIPAAQPFQSYQTLHETTENVTGKPGGSSVPCNGLPTYQSLDVATKNNNNPTKSSVSAPENYQGLHDVRPPGVYSKLNDAGV